MASLYKKSYTKIDPKTGGKVKRKGAKWWGKFYVKGRLFRVPLVSDKQAAQTMLHERDRKEQNRAAGNVDAFEQHAGRLLVEHLADYTAYVSNRGNTAAYVAKIKQRVGDVLTGCKFKRIGDISASRVQRFLADLQRGGRALAVGNEKLRKRPASIGTANHSLRATKGFTHWLVSDHRTADDRLAQLEFANEETDRRVVRRSLTADELSRLVAAAEAGPERLGFSGIDRAMLYVLAARTGLRRNELGSLTASSFDLHAEQPTVTAEATNTKNRKLSVLALNTEVARRLDGWLAARGPQPADKPLFAVTDQRTAEMLQADLAAARAAWIDETKQPADRAKREQSDFLAAIDADSRVVDFHALRATFISGLARAGVSLAVAQKLARHSTPTLTANSYTLLGLHDHGAAVESLPSISTTPAPEAQGMTLRATGTDDASAAEKVVPTVVPSGAQNGALRVASTPDDSAAFRNQSGDESENAASDATSQAAVTSASDSPHISASCNNGRGGDRTRTPVTRYGILSPVRLPIPPLGHWSFTRCHPSPCPPSLPAIRMDRVKRISEVRRVPKLFSLKAGMQCRWRQLQVGGWRHFAGHREVDMAFPQ